MRPREWLPNPPKGTSVCGGFDGSENDDWTAIRLETAAGFQFTPRWKASGEAMVWNPARHGGRIPRLQVHDAWAELAETFQLERVYCDPGFNDPHDPTSWISEIETWDRLHGPETFVPWQMGGQTRVRAVHAALVRFEADLRSGALQHDGCPVTTTHVGNAVKVPKPGDRFVLGKPAQSQKIDAAVTSVLCHEAAADALKTGWGAKPTAEYAYFA
ncbi:hypothetical protein [Blastococcus sp. SYSU D00813]